MSTAAATMGQPRWSRKGRVLFVGDAGVLSALAPQLPREPIQVDSLYDAIGEVGMRAVSEPIDTVLVSSQVYDRASDGAIEALRRVDPSVRIMLVTDSAARSPANSSDANSQRRVFDAFVAVPVSAADLATPLPNEPPGGRNTATAEKSASGSATSAAVGRSTSNGAADHRVAMEIHRSVGPASQAPAPGAAPVTAPPFVAPTQNAAAPVREPIIETSPEVAARSIGMAAPGATARFVRQSVFGPLEESVPEARTEGELPQAPEDEPAFTAGAARTVRGRTGADLGDTDLIEAILADPHGIRDTALQLIIEQTGWVDVTLIETRSERSTGTLPPVTADGSYVDVSYREKSHGTLRSAMASPQQLKPWADWLARWLAMDRAYRHYHLMAFQDDLTGAWNRRFFESFLSESIARASRARRPLTLMVFDIDNFKNYNDQFGHEAGDGVLRETVGLLNSVIRRGDRVCRIGGDEFVVVFADPEAPRMAGSTHPDSVETIARRFQQQVCLMRFPKLSASAPGRLSISAGLATYPWDGAEAHTLLRVADERALESKRRGKNAITFGREACQPGTDSL